MVPAGTAERLLSYMIAPRGRVRQRRCARLRLSEWKHEIALGQWVARYRRARAPDRSRADTRADAARWLGSEYCEGRTEDCGDSHRERKRGGFVQHTLGDHGGNRQAFGPWESRGKLARALRDGRLRRPARGRNTRSRWRAIGFHR